MQRQGRVAVWGEGESRASRHYNTGGLGSATILLMPSDEHSNSDAPVADANAFSAADVVVILRERGWLAAEPSLAQQAWGERAAAMLGGHAADRAALAGLLGLVFRYDAREIICREETHVIPARYAERNVRGHVA